MPQQFKAGDDVTALMNLKTGDDVTHLMSSSVPIEKPIDANKQVNSFLSDAWGLTKKAMEPIVHVPTSSAEFREAHPTIAGIGDFGANVLSGITSPLNVGTALMSGGSSLAARVGLPKIAEALNMGTKAASVPVMGEGAAHMYNAESVPQFLAGGLELGGGILGVRSKVGDIGESIKKPSLVAEEQNIRFNPQTNEHFVGDSPTIQQGNDIIDPNTGEVLSSFDDAISKGKKIPNYDHIAENGSVLVHNLHGQGFDGYADSGTLNFLYDTARRRGESLPEPPAHIREQMPDSVFGNVERNVTPQFNPRNTTGMTGSQQKLLPAELRGAKPRYNIGQTSYTPQFESDIDKALFIIAQKSPSKRDADYLKFVMDATGMDPAQARMAGLNLRGEIKVALHGQEAGNFPIPTWWKPNATAVDTGSEAFTTSLGGDMPPPPIPPTPPINPLDDVPSNPSVDPIIRRIKDNTPEQAGPIREAWNLSRGLMAVDLPFITSAGLRQGLPLIGTKDWFKAWIPSVKAYGSKAFYESHQALLNADPLMQRGTQPVLKLDGTPAVVKGRPVLRETPSIAEQAGVKFTDLSSLTSREESIRSQLAERIPVWGKAVSASNRAYSAYINDLRLGAFRNMYEAMPDKNNLVALKQLGDAVNTFTGRGPLKTKIPFGSKIGVDEFNMEKYASGLSEVLFAPKLIASRLQMLNPMNYTTTDPQVRKEYLKAALRTAGAWTSLSGLAAISGFAEVSLNPTSSDFGKIKIGNTRLDAAGGFQQFLVLAARLATGETTSSTSGQTTEMGEGFKPPTRGSTIQDFTSNKLHPSLKYFYDAAFANEKRQFGVFDRAVQLAIPMITGDLMKIAQESPELVPFLAPLISGGMGAQNYDGTDMNAPMVIPPEFDINIGATQ